MENQVLQTHKKFTQAGKNNSEGIDFKTRLTRSATLTGRLDAHWWAEQSASRRRAVAALWRAAKAEGWAHSRTLARMTRPRGREASWSAKRCGENRHPLG